MSVKILDQYGNTLSREKSPRELRDMATDNNGRRRMDARYDAAGLGTDLDKYWVNADHFDADSANSRAVRNNLVPRSRYEIANNGYSDGIAQTYATDLVGTGPQLRMATASVGFNQLVERTWGFWAKAINFRRKLWTMAHAKHVDGEALAILRVNPKVRHPVQLDISLRETEQCQTPFLPYNDPYYIDGIKFDKFDNKLWFDFLKFHPGGTHPFANQLIADKVPANRVLHWFKPRRPGQHRGVPECASTLNLGAAFRRLREASLSTAEKVAAWTLFLKTMFQPNEMDDTAPMSVMEIVHGMMMALPNNMEPYQLKAEQPGPTYDTFHRSLLSEQGRPKNMPYNKTACDSSSYNYASGRLDHQTYYGNLDVDREDGNDTTLDPLFEVWFELAVPIFGWLGGNPVSIGPGARAHSWDWPKHLVADIQAEATSNETKLRTGQIDLEKLWSDQGEDLEDAIPRMMQTYGIDEQELRRRLFDITLPLPKNSQPTGGDVPTQPPAKTSPAAKAFNGRLNGHLNGSHHAN